MQRKLFVTFVACLGLSGCVSQAQKQKDQADMNASVPLCITEKQCEVEWQAASSWVTQHCGMKIQTSTDSLIQTYNSPPNSPDTMCTVTRIPGPGHTAAFTIHVGCANVFGCAPPTKDLVIGFGTAIKEAGAPFQPLHVGAFFQIIDSRGQPTKVIAESIGLKVVSIEKGGRADMAGLNVDDVVLSMNGKRVRTLDDWTDTLENFGPGDIVTIKVRRAAFDRDLPMPL